MARGDEPAQLRAWVPSPSHRSLTPAKFVERARIETAHAGDWKRATTPVESVAVECGFGNAERMRRTFRRHMSLDPSSYRRTFIPDRGA